MLLVLCGIPGSGKTTYSKVLAQQHNAVLHTFDNLPGAFSPQRYNEVREQMWSDIASDLREGKNVVCDDLHTKRKWRDGLLSTVSDINCEKVLVVMTTPLDVCLDRNANRVRKLPDSIIHAIAEKYEPPETSEGWTQIIYY